MDQLAPVSSDIAKLLLETCCDALETGILVVSRSDNVILASRNLGSFYPVADQFLQPGTSLRSLLIALFDAGFAADLSGPLSRPGLSREEWVSQRIACLWHERDEFVERLGRERWLSVTTRRLASGFGIMLLRDVSAARKMEERWRTDLERVSMTEDILDNLPAMVCVLDRNLSYVAVNKAYSRFFGIAAENLLGRRLGEMGDPAAAERLEREIDDVLATGGLTAEYEIMAGRDGPMRVLKQCFRLGRPGHHVVVLLLQPFDEHVDLPERLPSAAIATALSPEAQVPHFAPPRLEAMPSGSPAVLLVSSEPHFGDALNDALRAFRFDSCRAGSFLEAQSILTAAQAAGVHVDLVMADDTDVQVEALAHFHGQVMPVSRHRPIHFAVAEAAALLARHPGSAQVESDVDYMPDFPEPSSIADPATFGVGLLVAEDNPINQEAYSQILGSLGISYELARDGAEAVRLWDLLRPPLVLMDLDMPVMSGIEATRRIRQMEGDEGRSTMIVGVLPKPSQERHAMSLAAGMDETIIKPLNVETLETLYRHHVLSDLADGTGSGARGRLEGAM